MDKNDPRLGKIRVGKLTPFGFISRHFRLKTDVSLSELATGVGEQVSTISGYEFGRKIPTEEYADKLDRFFFLRGEKTDFKRLISMSWSDCKGKLDDTVKSILEKHLTTDYEEGRLNFLRKIGAIE